MQHISSIGTNAGSLAFNPINIIAPGTAFTDDVSGCRAKSDTDTSEYLCQSFLTSALARLGSFRIELSAGDTSDLFSNTLVEQYLDSDGITLVETTAVMPSVTSVSHSSDADRTTTISDTVEDGAIYSVIRFSAGLAIGTELADPPILTAAARPQIFYQIGSDQRVQFGGHDTTGTPQNGTCALLDSTAVADQSFWCRYNTKSSDTGTYKIIVGTSTADVAGQTLAEYNDDTGVTLAVTAGTSTLSIASVSVNEADGMATVSVTVDEAVSGGFSVDAMTADGTGTATAGEDYTAVSGQTLSFAGTFAGETLSFTVPIIDDAIYEGGASGTAETVLVSLANLQDATNVDTNATALIRITDNDYEVVLTITDVSVREEDGMASGTVTLNAAVPDNFSVDISTADGSAIAGEDYTATNQTLSFVGTAGEPQTFSVLITDDTTPEFPETLTVSPDNLQVTTPTGTSTLRPATATITIRDNDLGDNSLYLNLLFPVTDNGKTYYYLDNDGNGRDNHGGVNNGDRVTHNALDILLNGGDDTVNTQDGSHNGQNDERSVIIGDTVLILPTPAEFQALRASRISASETSTPAGWWTGVDDSYWTSNLVRAGVHSHYRFRNDEVANDFGSGGERSFVAFQVIPPPDTLTFGTATIPNQTYPVGVNISVTLPTASGGTPVLSYTLTRGDGTPLLPGGLTFDPAAVPTISSNMISMFDTTEGLVYTVTDAWLRSASLTFTVKTVTVTVDTDAGETVDYLDGAIAATNIGGGVGGDNKNDMRLTLPSDNLVTAVAVTTYAPSTADAVSPPVGITFSDNTLDITLTPDALTFAATTPATVCLSTADADVPDGQIPALYHLPTATDPAWGEIGDDTATHANFVCGTTTTFSPFVVGYKAPTITETNTNTNTTRLNEQILSRASQAMTASTLEAVARRVDAAAGGAASSAGGTGSTPALAYQFGGQSSLSGLLKSHGKAMLEDNMEYEQLFDGASFVVPLSAAEGGTGGGKSGGGTLSLWGSSNFINLGSDKDELDWDGQVTSINVGVDKLVGKEMLAGFALSSNQSSFDYDDAVNDAEGEYNYSNTILHPYIGWFPGEGLKLWASVGFGSGEIEINDDGKHTTDTSQQSLSGGFSRWLLNSTELLSGGATTLNLKGDVSMTSVDVEAKEGSFAEQKVSSTRLRVLVSGEQQRGLASGGRLMPSLEAGVRYDGGDGVTGVGVELGGGLRYANPDGNLTVAGNVRTLLVGEYDELGVDFTVQLAPGSGRGLSFSLRPVWGRTQSAAERLWNDGASEITGGDTALHGSVDTEVGYGLAATMLGSPGILTPYTGMTSQDGGSSRLRLGGRFTDGNGLSMNLEGAQKNTTDGASHQVLLRGEVAF